MLDYLPKIKYFISIIINAAEERVSEGGGVPLVRLPPRNNGYFLHSFLYQRYVLGDSESHFSARGSCL